MADVNADGNKSSSKKHKYCFVPLCPNTTKSTPEKIFLSIPKSREVRQTWMKACRRDERKSPLSAVSAAYCCEDHFNMEEDMENYRYVKTMGGRFYIKKDVVPHIFDCQSNCPGTELLQKVKHQPDFERPMSPSDVEPKIHYLNHVDGIAEGMRCVAFVGDNGPSIRLPLLTTVAACPVLATAIDNKCSCAEDVCILLPDIPARIIEMFGDLVTGKPILGTYEDMMLLENICFQFGMKLDLSLLMTDNASEVYVRTIHEDNIVSENDVGKDKTDVNSFVDERSGEPYCKIEDSTLLMHAAFDDGLADVSAKGTNNREVDKNATLTCTDCKKLFPRRYQLQVHRCMTAAANKKSDITLREPISVLHSKGICYSTHIKKLPTGQFKCNLCGLQFKLQSWCKAHVTEHMGCVVFKCDQCKACFVDKQGCENHVSRVHKDMKPYKCQYDCNRRFPTKEMCRRHEKIHSKTRYKCKYCKKRFQRKNLREFHEKSHLCERNST